MKEQQKQPEQTQRYGEQMAVARGNGVGGLDEKGERIEKHRSVATE